MPRKKRRSFTQAFKLSAVERLATAESIRGLASELTVEQLLLYHWRERLQSGGSEALRRVGRPCRPVPAAIEGPERPVEVTDPAEARRRIEELERKACPWA